jgi:hypothetical protein
VAERSGAALDPGPPAAELGDDFEALRWFELPAGCLRRERSGEAGLLDA